MTSAALAAWMLSGAIQDRFNGFVMSNWQMSGTRTDTTMLTHQQVQPAELVGLLQHQPGSG